MQSLQELVKSIHDNINITTRAKVELLTYVSNIYKTFPEGTMNRLEMQMLDTYISNLISPPAHITAFLLSAHYVLNPVPQTDNTMIFDVIGTLALEKHFDIPYTSGVARVASALHEAKFDIWCRIKDPYHTGKVMWYDPFSTEMSVRWDDENRGYTVRDIDTTKRMFSMLKSIGEKK